MANLHSADQTLDSTYDRALLLCMGNDTKGLRALRQKSREGAKSERRQRNRSKDSFGFVSWQPDEWSEVPHAQAETAKCNQIEVHNRRNRSADPSNDWGEQIFRAKEFKRIAIGEDVFLGIVPSMPPERVFIANVLSQTWADRSGIEVGCELVRVNGETVVGMDAREFMAILKKRPLELSLLPPSETTAVFNIEVRRDEHGDGGFRIAHPPLSITMLDARRKASLHPMRNYDLVLAVNDSPVVSYDDYIRLAHNRDVFNLSLRHAEATEIPTVEQGDAFDVTVYRDLHGNCGFTLTFPPLFVARVDAEFRDCLHPMTENDLILAVNGKLLSTYAPNGTILSTYREFLNTVRGLDSFTLTLRHTHAYEVAPREEGDSYKVDVTCDQNGYCGFQVAAPGLSVARIEDNWQNLLQPMEVQDEVLAINNVPVDTFDKFRTMIQNAKRFIVTCASKRFDVRVVRNRQGFVGFRVCHPPLSIAHVLAGHAEALAPMQTDDLILAVNGERVSSLSAYNARASGLAVFTLTLRHNLVDRTFERESGLSFDVTAEVNEFGDYGFKLLGPPLSIANLEQHTLHPAKNHDRILAVNDLAVETVEDFNLVIRDQDQITLTLRRPERHEIVAVYAFEVTVTRDEDGEVGFQIAQPPLHISQLAPERAGMLYPMRDGDHVVAVDGTPVTFYENYRLLTTGTNVFALKLVHPEDIGLPRYARLEPEPDEASVEAVRNWNIRVARNAFGEIPFNLDHSSLQITRVKEEVKVLGMQEGDVIVAINGSPVRTFLDFFNLTEKLDRFRVTVEKSMQFGSKGANVQKNLEDAIVRVNIVAARKLRVDTDAPSCHPFCVCKTSSVPVLKFKTPILQNVVNPDWNHVHELVGLSEGVSLHFSVFDQDADGTEFLGFVSGRDIGERKRLARMSAQTRPEPQRKKKEVTLSPQGPTDDELYQPRYLENELQEITFRHAKPWQMRDATRAHRDSDGSMDVKKASGKVKRNIATGGDLTRARLVPMRVFEIRYSSDSIPNRFHDGSELFLESLKRFPPLKVAFFDGVYYALNNRYLYVLKSTLPQNEVQVEIVPSPSLLSAHWRPSTRNHGLRACIEQESTLDHVCFGHGPNEWIVVSSLKSGKQQFRYHGIPEDMVKCIHRNYRDGYDIRALGLGPRHQWFVAGQCMDDNDGNMFWGGLPDDFAIDMESCQGTILGVSFPTTGWLIRAEHNCVWRDVPSEIEKLLQSIYNARRFVADAAFGPNDEYFVVSATESLDGDHKVCWKWMVREFDEAMEKDIECVSIGGPDVFVAWSGTCTVSLGLDYHMYNCPEFN